VFNIFRKQDKTEESQSQEVKEQVNSTSPIEKQEEKSKFGISFFGLKEAISKTSESLVGNILSLTQGKAEIDDDLIDEMEERFIKADLGLNTTLSILDKLRDNRNKIKPDKMGEFLKSEFIDIIKSSGSFDLNIKDGQLNIILITGVNGAGKTTLIGKLAYRFKLQGKKVIVAAGDTFRAAAEDQLEIWTNRAGAQIVRQDGADPASVVFDSIKTAKAQNAEILLIDTAGRLQNKFNLMEELKKIKKVIDREAPNELVESMLVLEAPTGQNGLKQAEVFRDTVQLTSVALTKLDGTAKGGVIISIAKEFGLPVKLIGVGEKLEDLKDFNPDDYVNALFDQ
jgi:fused signal recognition particle receptor